MTDFSTEDIDNTVEAFPMQTLGNKTLKPDESETSSNTSGNDGNKLSSTSQQAKGRKVSWADVTTQNRSVLASGLITENVCQSCANGTRNRLVYQAGRMSLPLNGKYANNYHRNINGVRSSTMIPRTQGKENGVKSHLHQSQSGNTCCCGSSLSRIFQERDPEKPWKSKGDYFVAVLTYVLGVGNVIRFPQLCFKHGGGKEVSNNLSPSSDPLVDNDTPVVSYSRIQHILRDEIT